MNAQHYNSKSIVNCSEARPHCSNNLLSFNWSYSVCGEKEGGRGKWRLVRDDSSTNLVV